jgi:serine/threonine protein kinase
MWALGIILYQLVSNKHPFLDNANSSYAALKNIESKKPAPLQPSLSSFIKETIKKLLEKNPEARPDTKTLIDKEEIQVYVRKILSLFSHDKIGSK